MSGRVRGLALIRGRGLVGLALVALAAACAPGRPAAESPVPEERAPAEPAPGMPALPAIPLRTGPLVLDLVYPPEGGAVAVRDSTFVYGSTGTGRARLWINDEPVPVEPTGAFLAFLPVPVDGVYRLQATTADDSARLERTVRVPPPPPSPAPDSALIVEGSVEPTGAWAALPGEVIDVGFRGTAGGRAALLLPDGTRVPLVEEPAEAQGPTAFERPEAAEAAPETRHAPLSRYRGFFRARPLRAADPEVPRPLVGGADPAGDAVRPEARPVAPGEDPPPAVATLELVAGRDTARVPLPLTLALVDAERPPVGFAYLPERPPVTSGLVRGSAGPGYTFLYFWPSLTMFTVTGERDGRYRVHLAPDRNAWVPAEQILLEPRGAPPPGGRIGTVRMTPYRDAVDLRITLPERLPFHVREGERSFEVTVFGGVSDAGWLQYGGLDPWIESAAWDQPEDSVFRVRVELTQPPWGYKTFWDAGGNLVVRMRRPPPLDPDAPLRGLTVMVDPGHTPEAPGAVGPTRLTELEANTGIGARLAELLEDAGARVVLTPSARRTVGLYERRFMADTADAHIFVSVHNNAFPDGVNPYENNGTSVYYFHPHAADLAQALQRELVAELGLRDLGVGRASYAVVRESWMPAVLTETMFMMIPRQEAALRDPAVQDRVARAHLRALRAFLRARAEEQRTNGAEER